MAIYFIQAGAAGPIKIGTSVNVRGRLRATQYHHYEELTLLAVGDGCCKVEGMLHALFAEHHIRGEWFRPAAAIWSFIAQVKAGANHMSCCPGLPAR